MRMRQATYGVLRRVMASTSHCVICSHDDGHSQLLMLPVTLHTRPSLTAVLALADVVYRCANVNNASFDLTLNATAQERGCSYQATGVSTVFIRQPPCYTAADITRPFENACSTQDFPDSTPVNFTRTSEFDNPLDEGTATIPTPFPVSLYSTTSTEVKINTNGFLTLRTAPTIQSFFNIHCPLGDRTPPGVVLFAFWADLVVRESPNGGVCYETRTTATGREFVVTWDRAQPFLSPLTELSFSIILKEPSRAPPTWWSPTARSLVYPAIAEPLVRRMLTGTKPPRGAAKKIASLLAQTLQSSLHCCPSLPRPAKGASGKKGQRTASSIAERSTKVPKAFVLLECWNCQRDLRFARIRWGLRSVFMLLRSRRSVSKHDGQIEPHPRRCSSTHTVLHRYTRVLGRICLCAVPLCAACGRGWCSCCLDTAWCKRCADCGSCCADIISTV
jgi:hypothetical protein